MDRRKLADAMWDNFQELPVKARQRIALIDYRDYIDAVADDLGLEKVSETVIKDIKNHAGES